MKHFKSFICVLLLLTVSLFTGCQSVFSPRPLQDYPAGSRGAIATVHPLATFAGINAFKAGGNAIDAAIAAAFTLGVVDSNNSGIGGGCFILIRTAKGELFAIDGREMAPAAATRDMYMINGKPSTTDSQTGPLAIGIPGSLMAYDHAIKNYGKLALPDLIEPAAKIAENGFTINKSYVAKIKRVAPQLRQFPASAAVLLNRDGTPLPVGHKLKQPELARSYRQIASQGIDWFYKGPFAFQTDLYMKAVHGVITSDDFANYKIRHRTPLVTKYRDYSIVGFPPPSSGGIHVAQILNIYEQLLKTYPNASAVDKKHLLAQAMQLAFADRAYWLGDPDFAKVPRGLISHQYAKQLAGKVNLKSHTPLGTHGTPPDAATDLIERHTTHIAAADAYGNYVAITATLNTTFGSKVIIPGTGIMMNNQMDDFSIQPGVPNAFGLVGAEANSIAPGKRPLSSMSPTIILQNDEPVMTLGAAGGPRIITQVVQAIINHLDHEMPLDQAVAEPRIHHQWKPPSLYVEQSLSPQLISALKFKGYNIQTTTFGGVTQAIRVTLEGKFIAVHDPRVEGKALSY